MPCYGSGDTAPRNIMTSDRSCQLPCWGWEHTISCPLCFAQAATRVEFAGNAAAVCPQQRCLPNFSIPCCSPVALRKWNLLLLLLFAISSLLSSSGRVPSLTKHPCWYSPLQITPPLISTRRLLHHPVAISTRPKAPTF